MPARRIPAVKYGVYLAKSFRLGLGRDGGLLNLKAAKTLIEHIANGWAITALANRCEFTRLALLHRGSVA